MQRLTLRFRQRGAPAPRAALGGDALQVESLSDDVRERAVAAVEQLGAPSPPATRVACRSRRARRALICPGRATQAGASPSATWPPKQACS